MRSGLSSASWSPDYFEEGLVTYRTLVKLHGYTAVFFLPFALLYAVTGVLYIVGESGAAPQTVLAIPLEDGWPATVDVASAVVDSVLLENGLPAADGSAGARELDEGTFSWRALAHNVTLSRTGEFDAEIIFQQNGWYRRLVEIHKDHAGIAFSILGFAFGIAMIVLIISGATMMLRSMLYRKAATVLLACGTAVSLVAWFTSV